jgi:[ribosomal protein S5]-alanine N-acetyltransferase
MAMTLVRTERILLRPWTRGDVDALHTLWTQPEVRRYLWDNAIITRDTAEELVESHLATVNRYGIGYWALHIPPVPEDTAPLALIAGFCGFQLMDPGPEIELLYGLEGKYWGQGLATEAASAAIEYLWRCTPYQRVYARTDAPNERSVRVLLRLGMTPEPANDSLVTYVLQRPG